MATAVRRVHVLGCHYAIALSPLGSCSGRRFPVARVHKPPTRCLAQQAPPKARRGHGRGGEDADGRGDGAVGLRRRRFDPALPARHQPLRTKDDRCYDNEFADSLDADERQFYDSLTPKERAQLGVGSMTDFIGDPDLAQLVLRNGEQGEHGGEGEQGGDGGGGGGGADIALSMLAETEKQLLDAQRSISQDTKLALADMPVDVSEKEPRIKPGFFNYADPLDDEEDAEDEEGMGPLALQQLEEHRGIRDYTRRAVWELPMLKLHVPFSLPAAQPLRFRYTTYMGESHPAASKVVLEFCPTDLPDLTPAQQLTLIKIVGVRYHPGTEIVKMSCESFPEQAQNKRMLLRQLRSIIATVMDPTADHFEDIPVDTRHYRPKIRPVFPPHWALTDERRQSLEKQREAKALLEHQKASQGLLVDGEAKIQEVMARPVLVPIQMAAPVRQGNRKTGRRS